jgi:hypothetical protein
VTTIFDQPDQAGPPGSTIQFFGTIFNNTAATIYLNGDDLNLGGLSFTVDDQFFNNVPLSLAPFGNSGDIELFDVHVSNPLLDTPGNFPGTYDVLGGVTPDAQDVLGSAGFSATVTPEPGSFGLLLAGALVLGVRKARVKR